MNEKRKTCYCCLQDESGSSACVAMSDVWEEEATVRIHFHIDLDTNVESFVTKVGDFFIELSILPQLKILRICNAPLVCDAFVLFVERSKYEALLD